MFKKIAITSMLGVVLASSGAVVAAGNLPEVEVSSHPGVVANEDAMAAMIAEMEQDITEWVEASAAAEGLDSDAK